MFLNILLQYTEPSIDTGQGIVIAIISGVVTLVGAYFVNVLSKKQEGQSAFDLKKLELTDNTEVLKQSLDDALDKIRALEDTLQQERELRAKAESQLRDVKTAFSIVYISFENIVGDNEEGLTLLGKLKEFIET